MPKRTDIQSILIIGSGPIVIGQACEFDYSGTQALKALKEEGYRIILANSNPATIMTDPKMADATYIEPLTPEFLGEDHREGKARCGFANPWGSDGVESHLGSQRKGVLEKHNVEVLGANIDAIHKAEDRDLFRRPWKRWMLRWLAT